MTDHAVRFFMAILVLLVLSGTAHAEQLYTQFIVDGWKAESCQCDRRPPFPLAPGQRDDRGKVTRLNVSNSTPHVETTVTFTDPLPPGTVVRRVLATASGGYGWANGDPDFPGSATGRILVNEVPVESVLVEGINTTCSPIYCGFGQAGQSLSVDTPGGFPGYTAGGINTVKVTLDYIPPSYPEHPPTSATLRLDCVYLTVWYEPVSVITAVDLVALDSPIDVNPNQGGGVRIFPDKRFPNDVAHPTLQVRARTTLGKRKKVYFRSFDLDDPSDDPTLDSNGTAGGDNFGLPKIGVLTGQGTSGASTWAYTDDAGVATVTLTVPMQPGDNLMIAASDDVTYLNSPQLAPSGTGLAYGSTLLPTSKAKASLMLTVWRHVYVEVDRMQAVPNFGNSAHARVSDVSATPDRTELKITLANLDEEIGEDWLSGGSFASVGYQILILENTAAVPDGNGGFGLILTVPVEENLSEEVLQTMVQNLANQQCAVYDDDDYNGDQGLPDPITGHCLRKGDEGEDLRNVRLNFLPQQGQGNHEASPLEKAYVVPVTTVDMDGTASFVLNSRTDNEDLLRAEYQSYSGLNVARDDIHWRVFIRSGYQPHQSEDGDRGNGLMRSKVDQPMKIGGTVFLETQREYESAILRQLLQANQPTDVVTSGKLEAREMAKLVAFQIGCNGSENGLTDVSDSTPITEPEYYELSNVACRKIRSFRYSSSNQ